MSARCRDNPDECDRNYCQREKKCAERAASAPFSFVPDKGRQFDTEHPFSLPTNEQGRAAEGAVNAETQILTAERDSALAACERVARQAIAALVYHQDQTRPISQTIEAIGNIRAWLAGLDSQKGV